MGIIERDSKNAGVWYLWKEREDTKVVIRKNMERVNQKLGYQLYDVNDDKHFPEVAYTQINEGMLSTIKKRPYYIDFGDELLASLRELHEPGTGIEPRLLLV